MNIRRTSRTPALLALTASLLVSLLPVHGADPAGTRAAIEAQEKKYDEAYNNKDAAALASLYLEDAQILTAERGIVKGRKAIQAFR
jgi:hypothetical protein